jgi:lipase chaperone LimK
MIMKNISWWALVLFGTLNAIHADQFQLAKTKDGASADVAFASVKIVNGDKTTFEGKTDKYGRITVDLPKGQYEAVVTQGAEKTKAKLTIDGQTKLKQVDVH